VQGPARRERPSVPKHPALAKGGAVPDRRDGPRLFKRVGEKIEGAVDGLQSLCVEMSSESRNGHVLRVVEVPDQKPLRMLTLKILRHSDLRTGTAA
jgi:hypothetical protein